MSIEIATADVIDLEQFEEEITKLARQTEVKMPHWIMHHAGNEEGTFCYDCGQERLIELRQSHPDEIENLEELDGGWTWESDSCLLCDKCGVLLDYTLTDYGVESELSHFEEYGFDWTPDQAYELQAVMQGRFKDEQEEALKKIALKAYQQRAAQQPTQ